MILARRLRLVRREAGDDDLGFGEADRGDRSGVEAAAMAGDDLGDHLALRRGLVRQHRLADQVADRPHILHRRAALIVDFDEGPVPVEIDILKAPAPVRGGGRP